MEGPKFVQRVARIPAVLALLATYPEGLTLEELAVRFDTDADTMSEDLTTYVDLESWGWAFDIFRRSQIEFVGPAAGDDVDETTRDVGATVVRVTGSDPAGLGVEHLRAGDLAAIYTAGSALLDAEPDSDLAAALAVLADTMYGEDQLAAPGLPEPTQFLAPLQKARSERRRVRIVYSRAWRAGVVDRVVEPLRLIQTHRGWELDAGPVAPNGRLRTYLLAHLRDVEVLDEEFEPPSGLEALLAGQRRTTVVRMELSQDARWAGDVWAEQVQVVDDDQHTFVADLELLPPVGERVGLLMLAGGPTSRVLYPGAVLLEATALIEELLAHHES